MKSSRLIEKTSLELKYYCPPLGCADGREGEGEEVEESNNDLDNRRQRRKSDEIDRRNNHHQKQPQQQPMGLYLCDRVQSTVYNTCF